VNSCSFQNSLFYRAAESQGLVRQFEVAAFDKTCEFCCPPGSSHWRTTAETHALAILAASAPPRPGKAARVPSRVPRVAYLVVNVTRASLVGCAERKSGMPGMPRVTGPGDQGHGIVQSAPFCDNFLAMCRGCRVRGTQHCEGMHPCGDSLRFSSNSPFHQICWNGGRDATHPRSTRITGRFRTISACGEKFRCSVAHRETDIPLGPICEGLRSDYWP
jgi:hypothetical protein